MFSCQGRPMAVHHSKVIKVFQCPFMCSSGSILTMLMLTPLHLLPPFLRISTCLHFSHETALCSLSTGGSLLQWTPLPPHKIAMLIAQKRSMLTLLTNDQPSSPPVFTFLRKPHNVLSMMCLRCLMCLCLCSVCLIPQHFTLLTQPDNVLTMICLRLSAPVGKLYPLWERGH